MVSRDYIVDYARQYRGVPFRHQGRSMQDGVDCVGIIVSLARGIGLYEEDPQNKRYSRHPETFSLQKELDGHLERIPNEQIRPGDILLMRIVRLPQHVAIVTDYSEQSCGIIHTYESLGEVVEHRLNDKWMSRVVQAYKIPGVDE